MKLLQRVQWLPFIVYLYPVIAGFLVDSIVHDILGQYSISWFTFSILNLTLYPAFLWSHKKASLSGKSTVLGALCLMTVLAINNLQMVLSPYMVVAWSLTRLTAGLSLLTICFSLFQLQKYRNTCAVFIFASLLVGFSAADMIAANEPSTGNFPSEIAIPDTENFLSQIVIPDLECEKGFSNNFLTLNDEYLALHPFATGDILIIGDSITRGQPNCATAFPKILRRLEDTKFTPTRTVHAMTINGAMIPQHIALLNLLPDSVQFDRIILQFRYALIPEDPVNYIPPPNKLRLRINDFVFTLRYGGFSLDKLSTLLTPYFNNGAKFENVKLQDVRNIEAKSPTFSSRVDTLRQPLLQLSSLAKKHSQKPPIIIIFPYILPFEDYALEETNTILINLAQNTGFKPIDLLPIYKANQVDYPTNAIDLWHPGAIIHAVVAQYLAKFMD